MPHLSQPPVKSCDRGYDSAKGYFSGPSGFLIHPSQPRGTGSTISIGPHHYHAPFSPHALTDLALAESLGDSQRADTPGVSTIVSISNFQL